jgi:large subunit ribosomal protein L35
MKLKTKSSAKKRFSFTASGLIKMGQCGKRHNMRKRCNRTLRNARGMTVMDKCDAKRVAVVCFHV